MTKSNLIYVSNDSEPKQLISNDSELRGTVELSQYH